MAKKVASGAGETITSLTVMVRQYQRGGVMDNHLLLPTPMAADGTGGRQHKVGSITRTGKTKDGKKVSVSLRDALNLRLEDDQ